MAEQPFSTYDDQRVPVTTHYSTILQDGTKVRDYDYVLDKRQGLVKRTAGNRGGKFQPGVLKLRSFTAQRVTHSYGDATAEYQFGTTTHRADGKLGAHNTMNINMNVGALWNEQAANQSRIAAHAALNRAEFDVGMFLAELPETIGTIRSVSKRVLATVSKARSDGSFSWARANAARLALRDGKKLKQLPNSVASAWLEWRYAIRPLFWDAKMIRDIITAEKSAEMDTGLRRVRGGCKYSNRSTSSGSTNARENFAWNYDLQRQDDYKYTTVLFFRYFERPTQFYSWTHRYGLHPEQYPHILWEKVPLSFVVDWFVDINSWVKAISPHPNVQLLGQCTSMKVTTEIFRKPTGWRTNSGNVTGDPPHDYLIAESFQRRVDNPSFSIPKLNVQIDLDIQKQADLLALTIQRFLKRR